MVAPAQPASPPVQASSTPSNKSKALVAKLNKLEDSPFFAGLIMTLFLVPHLAGAFTILVYTSSHSLPKWMNSLPIGWLAIFGGSAIAFAAWLLLAWVFRSFTTANTASKYSGLQLRGQLNDLKAEFESLQSLNIQDQDFTIKKIERSIDEIEREIDRPGLRWVLASGYISTWRRLHRAQEAMILVKPLQDVIYDALHDEMRLLGSTIASSENELNKLRTALKQLSPSATIYLIGQPTDQVQNSNSSPKGINTAANQAEVDSGAEIEREARTAVREVRETINEYRDGLWEGLARSRNELMATAIIAGFLTYILLAIAIIADAVSATIIAAAGFEVVGALAGLFYRLYLEWNRTDSAGGAEDYYFALARIIVTPLLSGIAAPGGILVVRALSLSLVSTQAAIPALVNLFQPNLENFLVAAIFGLTPNLLIGTLQQRGENLQNQIKTSSAPHQAKS